jgi:hypothetical protein
MGNVTSFPSERHGMDRRGKDKTASPWLGERRLNKAARTWYVRSVLYRDLTSY